MVVKDVRVDNAFVVAVIAKPDFFQGELTRVVYGLVDTPAQLVIVYKVYCLYRRRVCPVGQEIRLGIQVDFLQTHALGGVVLVPVLVRLDQVGTVLQVKVAIIVLDSIELRYHNSLVP
jgi:hypothetical protein